MGKLTAPENVLWSECGWMRSCRKCQASGQNQRTREPPIPTDRVVGARRRGAPLLARQRRSINRRTASHLPTTETNGFHLFRFSPAGVPESAGWKPALPETRLPFRHFSRGASASLSMKDRKGGGFRAIFPTQTCSHAHVNAHTSRICFPLAGGR